MKTYTFGIGVLLILGFSFTGMTFAAVGMLRRFELRRNTALSMALAGCALVALLTALTWSVPPRG